MKKEDKKLGGNIPCEECGSNLNPIWYAENDFYNYTMGKNHIATIVCLYCFIRKANKKAGVTRWRIVPVD